MIRIQFDTIFLVCTFVLLSQASARFLVSYESSEEMGNYEDALAKLLKEYDKLKPNEQSILRKDCLNHLLALSEMQTNESKIEHEMLQELTKIPNFENDALTAIDKFRKVIEEGRKALDQLIEKRKKTINTQDPDIIRHYESMWLQVETKKRDEAKAALEKIDTFLSLFEKSLKSTVGDQLKTLQTMQDIIIERKKTVDLANTRDRKNIDTLHAIEKKDDGTTSAPESNSPLFLLDENDVKEIRELYNFWMRLPKLNLPESKKLIENIEKKGLSLSLFCKSIAEIHVIGNKARKCHDRGDTNGMDVLAKTLDQPNYKKVEEIINETPPPSLDSIANLVHLVRGIYKN